MTKDWIYIFLYALGVLSSAVGYVIFFLRGQGLLSATVTAVGIAVFLSGVAVNLIAIDEALKRLGRNIRKDIRRETQEIIEELDKELKEEKEEIILELKEEVLKKILPAPRVLLESMRPEQSEITRVAAKVICDFTTDYVGDLIYQLEEFSNKKSNKSRATIVFDHHQATYGILDGALRGLSRGAVWCGITHIGTKSAWDFSDQSFEHFQSESRIRSSHNELTMLRLYVTSDEHLHGLKEISEIENKANILTKFILVDNEEARKRFPDITLIWIPGSSREIISGDALKDNPVGAVESANYIPFALMEFEVDSSLLLSKVAVYHPVSPNFVTQKYMFSGAWAQALET